jgi:D-alanine-D-alanine ligase-like ATP-grasp enzyme
VSADTARTSAALTRALAAVGTRGGAGQTFASRLERLRLRGPSYVLGGRKRAVSHQMVLDRNRDEIYRRIWRDAAGEVGAEMHEFSPSFFVFRRRGRETLAHRDLVMLDSPATTDLASDKAVLQGLLRQEGLPVVPSMEAPVGDPSALLSYLRSVDGRCVVKPARGTGGGQGVTCGVRSDDDLLQAWLLASLYAPSVIIEEQVAGDEYRLLILDGELLGAVRRGIPHVVGDGRRTVRELIAEVNERRANGGPEEVSRLVNVDLDCRLALSSASVSLRTVLEAGQSVPIKGSASENGRLDNQTWDGFSPALVKSAARAADVARLRFAGIDLVTPDPTLALEDAGGAILEVNGTPGLRHHYQVAPVPKPVRVAVPLLERLLGERP